MLRQTLWLMVAKCGIVLTMCIRDIPMNTRLTANTTKATANNIIVIIFFKPFFKFVITQSFRRAKVLLFPQNTQSLCDNCVILVNFLIFINHFYSSSLMMRYRMACSSANGLLWEKKMVPLTGAFTASSTLLS